VDQNLDRINQKFDTVFLPTIRNILVDLCKTIKRKLQREGDNNKEDSKAKPIIHLEQEKLLRTIMRSFAHTDDNMLLNFMRLVQNMMRGMVYNCYIGHFTRFSNEFLSQANERLAMGATERFFRINLSYVFKEVHQKEEKHSKYTLNPDYDTFLKNMHKKIQDQLVCLNKFKLLLEESNRIEFNP
jgi:hypothetical protein